EHPYTALAAARRLLGSTRLLHRGRGDRPRAGAPAARLVRRARADVVRPARARQGDGADAARGGGLPASPADRSPSGRRRRARAGQGDVGAPARGVRLPASPPDRSRSGRRRRAHAAPLGRRRDDRVHRTHPGVGGAVVRAASRMSEGVDPRRVALLSFFIGIAAGAFGGLLGVGGGVIMVPLLTSVAGLTQHEAHAASLAGTVVTGLGGALTYAADQAVDFRVALILASVSVFATYAVAYHAARVPALKLRGVFGGFLILAAVLLIARDELLGLRAPAGSLTTIFL